MSPIPGENKFALPFSDSRHIESRHNQPGHWRRSLLSGPGVSRHPASRPCIPHTNIDRGHVTPRCALTGRSAPQAERCGARRAAGAGGVSGFPSSEAARAGYHTYMGGGHYVDNRILTRHRDQGRIHAVPFHHSAQEKQVQRASVAALVTEQETCKAANCDGHALLAARTCIMHHVLQCLRGALSKPRPKGTASLVYQEPSPSAHSSLSLYNE